MKKYLKTIVLGLAMVVASQSCTKLDEKLYNQLDANSFYTNPIAFISAIGPAYTNLGTTNGFCTNNNMFPVMELTTDEAMSPRRSDGGWAGDFQSLGLHTYTPGVGVIDGAWTYCYRGISTCNRVIETFNTLKVAGSQAYISELSVLRGLYYYWLIDLFGNVPLVTSFSTADPNPPNNTRAEVYQFIVNDIQANVNNLSKQKDLTTYGRINYYVGQTILAKLYLNSGVYKSTSWSNITPAAADLDSAITACNAVIDPPSPYSLNNNYFDNFSATDATVQKSPEVLFVIPYDGVNGTGMWLPTITLNAPSDQTYQTGQGPWNGFTTIQEFYQSYIDPALNPGPQGPVIGLDGLPGTGTQDIRLGSFIVGPQYTVPTQFPNLDPNGASPVYRSDDASKQVVYTPFVNDMQNADLYAGARLGKWQIVPNSGLNENNDFSLFRFSDVLLMKAEALWRKDPTDPTALALVNQVRTRAGVLPLAALTADNILAERGRELFAEGHRRNDQIRFGKFDRAWGLKQYVDDPHYNLFPIPSPQLGANPELKQNPGY